MTVQSGLDNLTGFTDRSTRFHPLIVFKLKGLHVSAMKRKKETLRLLLFFNQNVLLKNHQTVIKYPLRLANLGNN